MTGWTRAILYARSMCSSMRWNSATSGSMASHLGHAGVHRLPQAEGLRSGALRLPARPEEDDGAAGHDHGLHGVERDIGELHPERRFGQIHVGGSNIVDSERVPNSTALDWGRKTGRAAQD